MDEDILKSYSEAEVHAWYERLARSTLARSSSAGVTEPLAGQFLLHYIGKNGTHKLGNASPQSISSRAHPSRACKPFTAEYS
jgi:hypothetical protein